MATAKQKFEIRHGPSKSDLQTALFVRSVNQIGVLHGLDPVPVKHFVRIETSGRNFNVEIIGVEAHDDSAESWIIKGNATPVDIVCRSGNRIYPRGTFRFRGRYSTKTRKGDITLFGYQETIVQD